MSLFQYGSGFRGSTLNHGVCDHWPPMSGLSRGSPHDFQSTPKAVFQLSEKDDREMARRTTG